MTRVTVKRLLHPPPPRKHHPFSKEIQCWINFLPRHNTNNNNNNNNKIKWYTLMC